MFFFTDSLSLCQIPPFLNDVEFIKFLLNYIFPAKNQRPHCNYSIDQAMFIWLSHASVINSKLQ